MTEAPTQNSQPVAKAEEVDEVLAKILAKITPLNETKPNLKVLLYSLPDGGKTTFAATAPHNLVIDAEDGTTSLANNPELLGAGSKRMPYINFAVTERVIQYLNEKNPEFDWVETLTIDTLSELHKKGLAEVTEREFQKSPLLNNRYVAETEHHTENNEHIRRLVSSLKDLDRNLIILAHSKTVEQKGKPVKTYPDFSEKLANTLAAMMDIVIYLEKKEIDGKVQRVFHFHTDANTMTKSRIGGLPAAATDVTWEVLWKKFQEHLSKQKQQNK